MPLFRKNGRVNNQATLLPRAQTSVFFTGKVAEIRTLNIQTQYQSHKKGCAFKAHPLIKSSDKSLYPLLTNE